MLDNYSFVSAEAMVLLYNNNVVMESEHVCAVVWSKGSKSACVNLQRKGLHQSDCNTDL